MGWTKGKLRTNGGAKPKAKRRPGSTARLVAEQRHRLPLPIERHEALPCVIDGPGLAIIAPWPRNRPQPGDLDRLAKLINEIDVDSMRGGCCWAFSDGRKPVPLDPSPGWLAAWSRDRAVYSLHPSSSEAR
jgi:hypothetical protein